MIRKFLTYPYLDKLITYTWYYFLFKKLGNRCLIRKVLFITPKYISIGNEVSIWKNARMEGVGNYQGKSFSPSIILEDGVSIQQNLHLTCAENVTIGKDTAIAANVSITDIIHPYEDILIPVEKQPISTARVRIGEDCKIYNNVVILPGTVLGRHCVVGANSVVKAGNYPDYSVIVGSPAVIVKRYCLQSQQWLKTNSNGDFVS